MYSFIDPLPTLQGHINLLKADIEEKKRNIRREEEINDSLEAEYRQKTESIKVLKEKSSELDTAVKQMHEVYLNQKEASERLEESSSILRKQLETKTEQLEGRKKELLETRTMLEEKLKSKREKFQNFMEKYKKIPGVEDFLKLDRRLHELRLLETEATEQISSLEIEITKMRCQIDGLTSGRSNAKHDSIASWGLALAKKYVFYTHDQRTIANLRSEIEEKKARIAQLKEMKIKKEKAAYEMKSKIVLNQKILNDVTPVRNFFKSSKPYLKTRKLLDFSKLSSTNFKDFLKLGSKTPARLRSSVPNLTKARTENFKLPATPEIKENSVVLSRTRSMSALANGSSGSAVAPSLDDLPESMAVGPSLQQWLSTASQKPGDSDEAMEISEKEDTPQIPQITMKVVEDSSMQTGDPEGLPSITQQVTPEQLSETCPPSQQTSVAVAQPSTPVSSSVFGFSELCKSPEDDFKYSTHVFPTKAVTFGGSKEERGERSSYETQEDNPFNMLQFGTASPRGSDDKSDFQFAVPTAPPPIRSTKSRSPTYDKMSIYGGEDVDMNESGIFMGASSSSGGIPFRGNEGMNDALSSGGISFGFEAVNTDFATLFGSQPPNEDDRTQDVEAEEFQGFESNKAPGAFANFFGFTSPGSG